MLTILASLNAPLGEHIMALSCPSPSLFDLSVDTFRRFSGELQWCQLSTAILSSQLSSSSNGKRSGELWSIALIYCGDLLLYQLVYLTANSSLRIPFTDLWSKHVTNTLQMVTYDHVTCDIPPNQFHISVPFACSLHLNLSFELFHRNCSSHINIPFDSSAQRRVFYENILVF